MLIVYLAQIIGFIRKQIRGIIKGLPQKARVSAELKANQISL